MPDGGTGVKDIVSFGKDAVGVGGGLASIAGVASSFMQKKPEAPDFSHLTRQANEESAAAKAETARIEAEEATRKRLRMSGNYGRRSLMENGDTGFATTLGGS